MINESLIFRPEKTDFRIYQEESHPCIWEAISAVKE